MTLIFTTFALFAASAYVDFQFDFATLGMPEIKETDWKYSGACIRSRSNASVSECLPK
jgi:hypothetical protein